MVTEEQQRERPLAAALPAGEPGSARETINRMLDAGLLDEVMERVDAGGLALTGEGRFPARDDARREPARRHRHRARCGKSGSPAVSTAPENDRRGRGAWLCVDARAPAVPGGRSGARREGTETTAPPVASTLSGAMARRLTIPAGCHPDERATTNLDLVGVGEARPGVEAVLGGSDAPCGQQAEETAVVDHVDIVDAAGMLRIE